MKEPFSLTCNTQMKTKAIRLQDPKFHKQLMRIKLRHGFSSMEQMLKAMTKLYVYERKEVIQCLKEK